jgi:hypothetical protein
MANWPPPRATKASAQGAFRWIRNAGRGELGSRGTTHLGGEVLEEAVLADAVLEAELLPELHPDLVPALPHLDRDDLARHLLRPFLFLLRRRRGGVGLRSRWWWWCEGRGGSAGSPAAGLGFWPCLVRTRVLTYSSGVWWRGGSGVNKFGAFCEIYFGRV